MPAYLLQHRVLLLGGEPQVALLARAELGRLLLELLLALLDGADLLAAEPLQGLDELLVGPLQLQQGERRMQTLSTISMAQHWPVSDI